jgi:two-component system CheB/CheR fusion protein
MVFRNLEPQWPESPGSRSSTGSRDLDTAQLSGRRVLVVDDNIDAADSLSLMLQLLGAEVSVAYDGPSAINTAVREQPQLVLLDIGMPGMDGLETARLLRARSELPPDMRLIALTGWGQTEDQERSRSAGFDLHLVKPVEIDTLVGAIGRLNPA